jgi:hypothetical protein
MATPSSFSILETFSSDFLATLTVLSLFSVGVLLFPDLAIADIIHAIKNIPAFNQAN